MGDFLVANVGNGYVAALAYDLKRHKKSNDQFKRYAYEQSDYVATI